MEHIMFNNLKINFPTNLTMSIIKDNTCLTLLGSENITAHNIAIIKVIANILNVIANLIDVNTMIATIKLIGIVSMCTMKMEKGIAAFEVLFEMWFIIMHT